MGYELKDCLNTDILLRVYSFLPKEDISLHCQQVNHFWKSSAEKKYILLKECVI